MDGRMTKQRSVMRAYARGVAVADTITLSATSLITYLINYGAFQNTDNINNEGVLRVDVSPQFVGGGLLLGWLIFLAIFKTRDYKIVGSDFSEYRRTINSSLTVLGTLALVALYFKVDVSRVYVTEVLTLGSLALLIERRLGRAWLRKQRRAGRFTRKVAIYGNPNEIELEIQKYKSFKDSEFEPVLIIQGKSAKLEISHLTKQAKISATTEDLYKYLQENGVEILQVVGTGPSSAEMHRTLYWALDGYDISFVVSPAITGVSSSKLNTRVIAGTPLMEITSTKFTGPQYFIKTLMDLVLGTIAFIVSAPIVLVTAIFVKLEDKGPVFFTQTRLGLNGKPFTIYKIRSMKVGAELLHAEMQKALADNATNKNMYKNPEDPRVTRVGKVIRKLSIDELPQFLNVLKGDMSLVGPRPPLLSEVQDWQKHESRRLLVRPGITGPWQIGGRSTLTWEETVAIDLSYVQNWTVATDLAILLRTATYLFTRKGAY